MFIIPLNHLLNVTVLIFFGDLSAFPQLLDFVGVCLQHVMYVFFNFLIVNVDVFCVLRNHQVGLLLLEILHFLIHCVIVFYDIYFGFYYAFLQLLKVVRIVPLHVQSSLGFAILYLLKLQTILITGLSPTAWPPGVDFRVVVR